ncbi:MULTISPECIES: hypothetical protein [Streptomyces]|uniref:hypothetical protein n=1 Tax=Streptomyces TaxID=1883 RepID=UPI0022541576|nr:MULTISPECIES: hypothetical protein [Streptomyces]MCX5275355.1 hypothetical protein [Streptomyces virginiae]MCX5582966.1 hypothetical protein [Streptomyces erythrochromogenes]
MQIIDLAEQTRVLGQVGPTLKSLRQEVESVKAGEIAKPMHEIGPVAIRAQMLALTCTQQVALLATSQYAAMKDGHQNLAELVEATTQISLAATLCTLATHDRTEVLLYEGADETPAASRTRLTQATEELDRAATTYRRLAQRLSYRLASFPARREDEQLIARAAVPPGAATSPTESTARREDTGNSAVVTDSPRPITAAPATPLPGAPAPAAPARSATPTR